MDESEMKAFQKVQSTLALVAYVEEHDLAINPATFLRRDDAVAHKIRHDAAAEWTSSHPDASPSLAELFRQYWQSHREEILTVDMNEQSACSALITKIHGIAQQMREAGS